jgi:hypothetical protein
MKYRHEQMIRARERRRAQRRERQEQVEAALRSSLTADEWRQWLIFSEAVGRVRSASPGDDA